MSFDQMHGRVSAALSRIVKDAAQRIEYEMAAFVEKHLDEQGPPKGIRSTSKQIGAQSGRLSRSFVPGQGDHVSAFEASGSVFTVRFGTRVPYAMIHEHGGTIQHPGSSKRQAFRGSDGRLVVTSHTAAHAIQIPARPYMGPALKDFEAKGLPRHMQKILAEAIKVAHG